jgi:beta-N-acetylhexosaminidase
LPDRAQNLRRLQFALAAVVAIAVGGIAALVIFGGSPERKSEHLRAAERPKSRRGGERSIVAALIPPPSGALPGAAASQDVARRVRGMPLEQKVAQLVLVGFAGTSTDDPIFSRLGRRGFGGVVIDDRNYDNPAQLEELPNEATFVAAARRLDPPLVMAPQEGGDFSAFQDLPPAKAAADLRDVAEARAQARLAARRLHSLGLNGVLAPMLDVGPEDGGAVGARAYSDDPREVASYGKAVVQAYRRERILAVPGHFPGIGGAAQSTDEGPTQVGLLLRDLERRDVIPFRAAFAAGARAVLLGHAGYVTDDFVTPASLSRALATDLLRGKLGFRGIAITDDLAAAAITAVSPVPRAAVQAIAAGADMVWISGPIADQEGAVRALLRAVRTGKIPRRRIDGAVTRILTVKRELGLVRGRRPRRSSLGAPGVASTPGVLTR